MLEVILVHLELSLEILFVNSFWRSRKKSYNSVIEGGGTEEDKDS